MTVLGFVRFRIQHHSEIFGQTSVVFFCICEESHAEERELKKDKLFDKSASVQLVPPVIKSFPFTVS